MPEVTEFNGVKIYVNFDDHDPPHFHVGVALQMSLLKDATLRKKPYNVDVKRTLFFKISLFMIYWK